MWMMILTKIKELTVGVMEKDAELGLKISATLLFTLRYKMLVVMGVVDLGFRPDPLPTII